MRRRSFIGLGLGAAAVLAVAGGGLALLRPGLEGGRLGADARLVFAAVARGVLSDSLPPEGGAREKALAAHLDRLDSTLAGLPAHAQAELSQLLALLACAPGRMAIAGLGADWPDATVTQVQQVLQGMRTSSVAMRQQVYHALRELTNAAYFADGSAWVFMGYPGPRNI